MRKMWEKLSNLNVQGWNISLIIGLPVLPTQSLNTGAAESRQPVVGYEAKIIDDMKKSNHGEGRHPSGARPTNLADKRQADTGRSMP
jgi:hypothetical protein